MSGPILVVAILAALVIIAFYVFRFLGNAGPIDGSPMSLRQQKILIGYLLLLGFLLVYI